MVRSGARLRAFAGCVCVGLLAWTGAAGLSGSATPAAAAGDGPGSTGPRTRLPVAPLQATVNAAAYRPLPAAATFAVDRYDDSREHDAVAAALMTALAARSAGPAESGRPLDLRFDLYVIRSGVPVMAKGLLEMPEARPVTGEPRQGLASPPGIDVTALQGRTGAVEGNVLHRRRDRFSAVMRLRVSVVDPGTGTHLWRGWVDTPMNGLSRADVAGLVAGPLLDTLGETVAARRVVVAVPESLGGATTHGQ